MAHMKIVVIQAEGDCPLDEAMKEVARLLAAGFNVELRDSGQDYRPLDTSEDDDDGEE